MSLEGASAGPAGAAPPLLNDRYELGERLAEGTFFFIHRGRDVQAGRAVAIRVLKPEYRADDAFVSRLLSEAQSAATLVHPHIARVYDAWKERGTVVIVTEWVQGINLKDRIRRVAPFPLSVSTDILLAVGEALAHAHGRGFVHGDVRPGNVLITADGQVKVIGFGTGTSIFANPRTQLDALPQAAPYLAPELTEGTAPDARSDLYSLGCMLYEMLAGQTPYSGESPLGIAARHRHDPVPSLRSIHPAVPKAVDGIARKCMQKEPAERYPGIAELLTDIRAVREALRENRPLNWSPLDGTAGGAELAERKRRASRRREEWQDERDDGPSLKLLTGIAVVGVLMVALFFGVISLALRKPAQVTVPYLVGMTQAQAQAELEKAGLTGEARQEYHDKVEVGRIFDTHPKANMDILRGRSVMLMVSRGPQPVSVPDVVGKQLGEAQAEIQAAGLVLEGTKEEFSEVVEKGRILGQTPTGGSSAARKTPVTLIVSKGPEPIREPETVDVIPTDPGEEPAPDEEIPPDQPGEVPPAADLPTREHEIAFSIPASRSGPQMVKIVVRNQDGSEAVVYEREHQPGDPIAQTVTTLGERGKAQIRVYLNGQLIHREKV